MNVLSRRHLFRRGLTSAAFVLLSGCTGPAPWSQRPRPIPRVGHLWAANTTPDLQATFRAQLRELGYPDEQSIIVEDRAASGEDAALTGLASELVRMPVDVIVTTGTPATLAAKKATDQIPIVQASGAVDLVREGLADSHARPGGNVTGLGAIVEELSGKQLDILSQTVPGLRRVAVLWNPDSPATGFAWHEAQNAARSIGLDPLSLEVRDPEELEHLIGTAQGAQAGALLVLIDALTATHRRRIAQLALAHRLPSMFDRREYAGDGGLMAYGPSFVDMHRRAADYVDKILKGAKPGDLPIERPSEFDFAINLKTAAALGTTIPQSVLLQATEVIQ